MGGPHHVVFTPVVSKLASLLLLLFTVLWWLFPSCLIILLFPLIECVLFVVLLLALVSTLLSLICNGVELGIQLKLAPEGIESGSHCHNFLVVGRVGSPNSFGLEPIELAFG